MRLPKLGILISVPRKSTPISVESNNNNLVEIFLKLDEILDVRFISDPGLHSAKYSIYLADLSSDITNLSQDLIRILSDCQERQVKIVICLIFKEKIDIEKVHYLKKLLESIDQSPPLYRLCFVRDLYQDVTPLPATYLDSLLYQAIQDSKWKTSIKGKNLYFPLHVVDFVSVIKKILFLNNTSGKNFWVFGDKYSDLEIGFLLKNILSDTVEIFDIESTTQDFEEEAQYFNSGNDTQISLGWRPDSDFDQHLKKLTEQYCLIEQNKEEIKDQQGNSLAKKKFLGLKHLLSNFNVKHHGLRIRNRFLALSLKGLIAVSLIYIATAAVFYWSLQKEYSSLNQALNLAGKGELEKSVAEVDNLRFYNQISQFTIEPIKPVIQLVHPQTAEELNNLFAFNNYLSLSLENLQQTYVLADKIYKSLQDSQVDLDSNEVSLALQSNLSLVYENLIQIKVSLESKKLPGRVVEKIKKSDQFAKLAEIESQISQAMKLTEVLPVILGSTKAVNLGILVQDQDEIRPTGGLIKRLIVLTFQSGKITDTKSWSPLDIDAVAEGSSKAPEILSRITGTQNFKFSDMNYAADFSQTAEYISWFLERTIDLDLDFLVGLNKSFFEKMLAEDQALEINGKVIKVQDLRSTSSDTDISKEIVDYYLSAFDSGKLPLVTLGRAVLSEIEEGNLKIFSKDESTKKILARLPLSGIIADLPCHSGLSDYQNCLSQVTYLNEGNFIFAPVNHSLTRETVHSIDLGSDQFTHEYRLKYSFKNDFSLLNRPYQVIYQLFAPSGSEVNKIEVDGQQSVEISSLVKLRHGQFEYFQIPLSFPALGDHEVNITFSTPLSFIFDPAKTALSFTEIRQPGLSGKGTLLMVKIADNTRPLAITHQIQTVQGSLAVQLPPQTTTFGLGLGY